MLKLKDINAVYTKVRVLGLQETTKKLFKVLSSEGMSGVYRRVNSFTRVSTPPVLRAGGSGLQKYWDLWQGDKQTGTESEKNLRLLVHVQLYNLDFLDSIVSYLENIPQEFDLLISCNFEVDSQKDLCKLYCLKNAKSIQLVQFNSSDNTLETSYTDILKIVEENDILLQIHNFDFAFFKPSLWFQRENFYRQFLINEYTVSRVLRKFSESTTAMVYEEPFFKSNEEQFKGKWFTNKESLLRRFGVKKCFSSDVYCASGMFWVRIESIKPILQFFIQNLYQKADLFKRLIPAYVIGKGKLVYIANNSKSHFMGYESSAKAKYALRSTFFNKTFYTHTYPDVAAKTEVVRHYKKYGIREGRKGFPAYPWPFLSEQLSLRKVDVTKFCPDGFDPKFYLSSYIDAAEEFLFLDIPPIEHYQLKGRKLGYLVNGEGLADELAHLRNEQNIKISVVIPVYNSEHTIAKCLDSILNQSYKNIEIIAVDDGSQDNSRTVLQEYKTKYPSLIKLIYHDGNKGLVQTHTDGINAVTGTYFTVLDGDDWLDEDFCEKMIAVAENLDVGCVCCKWTRPVDYKYEKTGVETDFLGVKVLEGELKDESIVNWKSELNIHYGLNRKIYNTNLWRRISPIQINPKVLYWEDASVTIRFMLSCTRVALLENYLYNWFNNPASVSNVPLSKRYIDDMFSVLDDLSFLTISDKLREKELFSRNVENIFLGEFLTRLQKMVDLDKVEAGLLIEYFSNKILGKENFFSFEQLNRITNKITRLYFECVKNEQRSIGNYVLFVDPVGINDLQSHFLEFWSSHSQLPFEYIKLEKYLPLSKRINNIKLGAGAKLVITSGGWSADDFNTVRPIVQLWHGMGAIKKVDPHPVFMKPILSFCSSKDVQPIYSKLFGVDKNQVLPFGSIVADDYLDEITVNLSRERFLRTYPQCSGKKVYLWAPTFRGKSPHLRMGDSLDLQSLSLKLRDDEIFLIKLHPAIKEYDINFKFESHYENVIDVTSYPDLMDILSVTNVYIGDYSSSVHYALLLNIPVCFMLTDYDEYSFEQGLLLKKEDFPGEVCETTDISALLAMIRASVVNEKYIKFKNWHLGGCTGNSKQQIFNAIESLLNKSNN